MRDNLCGVCKNGVDGSMKGYFYMLLITAVCGGACSVLAWGGFERYIKYIVSLVCILIMILPFKSVDISEITENLQPEAEISETQLQTGLYKTSAELTEKQAKEYISQIVLSKFGIKPAYTHIKIDWTEKEAVIREITVGLPRNHERSPREIREYLTELLGGEVTVVEE